MRSLDYRRPDFLVALRALNRRHGPAIDVEAAVSEIIAGVRAGGDRALVDYHERFGGSPLDRAEMRVSAAEFAAASGAVDARTQAALAEAHQNVREFAHRGLRRDWKMHNRQGAEVGERYTAFPRVGIYVPGGTAPLVSTAVMTCTLAQMAGVEQIVVTTPAGHDGAIAPALLVALERCGATEVYKVGGAHAIAALAYGTPAIHPVAKIFGPGNAYVVEAKRQVFGTVAIDLLPGPSEILVLADGEANPRWIAADLLAQAEHGADSVIGLVTDSEALIAAVKAEIERQLQTLHRRAHLASALERGAFFCLVADLMEAVNVANDFAPEHLAVMTRDPEGIAAQVNAAGAIFVGGWSPVAGGDFLAGPSHTLPTGGAGKSFAGLTVDQFQRRTSVIRFDEESLRRSLPAIQTFSHLEGLDAHGRSAELRF